MINEDRYLHTYISTELYGAIHQHSLAWNMSIKTFVEMAIHSYTTTCYYKYQHLDSVCTPSHITPFHQMPWKIPLSAKSLNCIETFSKKWRSKFWVDRPLTSFQITLLFQEAIVWQILIDDDVRHRLWPTRKQIDHCPFYYGLNRNEGPTGRIRLDWYSYEEISFEEVMSLYFNYRTGYKTMIEKSKPKTVSMFVTADMYNRLLQIRQGLGVSQNVLFEKAIEEYIAANEIAAGNVLGAPRGGQPIRVTVNPKLYFEVNEKANFDFQPLNNVFFTAFYHFIESRQEKLCA